MRGSVVTVHGEQDPRSLGVTLPHEHVLWRSHFVDAPTPEQARLRTRGHDPVTVAMAGELAGNPFLTADNLRQDDASLAADELAAFRSAVAGAATVVDVTCHGLGPDVRGLADVARKSGVAIVAATGWYLEGTHPAGLAGRSVEDLAAELVRDLTIGVGGIGAGGTGVRAGIIGELGVGQPMYAEPADGPRDRALIAPAEERVLRAAAAAHRATGAPISIHLWNFGPNALARRTLDVLEAEGVDPGRVAIGHLDAHLDLGVVLEVARRGAFVEFDAFGVTPYDAWDASAFATDKERIGAVLAVLDAGHAERLLLSQDVCTKAQLHAFGGAGYDHLERRVVPALRARGVDDADLRRLRIDNPARLLTWAT